MANSFDAVTGQRRLRRTLHGIFYVGIYLIVTLSPLFVLVIGPTQPGRAFWTEFSVALGFAGLAVIGFQFLLTARFQHLTSPYGIDIVYHFHRQISLLVFALIVAHPVILLITRTEEILVLLNVVTAPWRTQTAVFALLALTILIVTSVWRIPLGIPYEPWRIAHGLLSVLAVGLALTHVVGIGYYVSLPWQQALWIALGLTWISALLYVRVAKPFMMLRRPYKVVDVIEERGNTWTIVMEPKGHPGLRFMPGQFAWVTILNSPFAVSEHPFSISSSAVTPELLHFTIKSLGDFTSTIKDVPIGTRAYIDGPYGAFTLDIHRASGYVFIAGGIGITPIMSMLRTLADRRDSGKLLLIYATKTLEQATFKEEIDTLKERLNLQVVYVPENPPEQWEGESGFINAQLIARYLPEDRSDLEYFVCGPVPMMNVVEDARFRLGLPVDRVQSERFNLV